jgi:hypothetical protein
MTFEELFDRAEGYDVDEEDVRRALTERRERGDER